MTHEDIRVGDIVNDLAQSGAPKMQVVDVLANDLPEYNDSEGFDLAGYKSHPHLPVEQSDRVLACVYLPDDPGSVPSGNNPYAIPSGRLARVPVEEANQGLRRVQEALVVDVLERLFATAARGDMASDRKALFDVATHAGIPEDLVDEALELSDVEATIGGEE